MNDVDSRTLESRRLFLERLGWTVGGAALLGLGALGVPERALAQVCAPPGPPGSARAWRRDCRTIRPRRPASTLGSDEIQKLKSAYKAMRDLAVSDPNDPRGFVHQAHIHCWNCGQGVQVHGSWQFFAWHRAYLYFHERILGKLIGDTDFRLPYWDWDTASHRKLPGAYTSPNDASNPLWNGTRFMSPTDEVPDEDVGTAVMTGVMGLATFTEFGGGNNFSGSPEGTPHGSVHVDVGGDMGAFSSAGNDPVFYAHHSNVDKVWSDWNKISATHTNPTDPAFLNLTFTFFDENRVWTSIKASQLLNHETQLRYIYGPSRLWEILPCILDWIRVTTTWRTRGVLDMSALRTNKILQKAGSEETLVRLHLERLNVPRDRSAVYRVYAGGEEAKQDGGPESSGYLGTVPFVLNDEKNRHPARYLPNPVLNVTYAIRELLKREGPVELFLVERSQKEQEKRMLRVRAREAYFTVARQG